MRKELEDELARLRKDLKVPDPDPAETLIVPKKKNPETKKEPTP